MGQPGVKFTKRWGAISRPSVYSEDLQENYKSIMEVDKASGPEFSRAPVLSVRAKVMGMLTSRLGAEDDEDVATTTIILPSVYLKKALELAKTILEGERPKHPMHRELMKWALPKKMKHSLYEPSS